MVEAKAVYNTAICYLAASTETFLVIQIVNLIIFTITPFLIMLFTTITVSISTLRRKRTLNPSRTNAKELRFMKTGITLNVLFFVLRLPASAITAYVELQQSKLDNQTLLLLSDVSLVLLFVYNSLPFFLYFTVNSIFRNEIFTKLRHYKKVYLDN